MTVQPVGGQFSFSNFSLTTTTSASNTTLSTAKIESLLTDISDLRARLDGLEDHGGARRSRELRGAANTFTNIAADLTGELSQLDSLVVRDSDTDEFRQLTRLLEDTATELGGILENNGFVRERDVVNAALADVKSEVDRLTDPADTPLTPVDEVDIKPPVDPPGHNDDPDIEALLASLQSDFDQQITALQSDHDDEINDLLSQLDQLTAQIKSLSENSAATLALVEGRLGDAKTAPAASLVLSLGALGGEGGVSLRNVSLFQNTASRIGGADLEKIINLLVKSAQQSDLLKSANSLNNSTGLNLFA